MEVQMKKTLAVAVFLCICLCLSAAIPRDGMKNAEIKDSRVLSFVKYVDEKGVLDDEFVSYSVFTDSDGDYMIVILPKEQDFAKEIVFFFEPYMIEFFWYSNIIIPEDSTSLAFEVINMFSNYYANWATFTIDTSDHSLNASAVMTTAGIGSFGEAVSDTLEMFTSVALDGFAFVYSLI